MTKNLKQLPYLILFSVLFGIPISVLSQSPALKLRSNLKTYIARYSETAVRQMIEFKIPASVILAQAIFESASGTSNLAKKSNNHFGVKCHNEWYGDTIVKHDDTLNECFRKYERVEQSYRDHSLFLITRERYTPLFELSMLDYAAWCKGLQTFGYATYSTYANELIKLIEEEKLYELDRSLTLSPRFCFKHYSLETETIKESPYYAKAFSVQEFCKSKILWLDERDVFIQSLDLIIENVEEETDIASGE